MTVKSKKIKDFSLNQVTFWHKTTSANEKILNFVRYRLFANFVTIVKNCQNMQISLQQKEILL